MTMPRKIGRLSLLAAAVIATGCATTPRVRPEVVALENELIRLRADPHIAPYAAPELQDAAVAIEVIEDDQHRMDPDDFDQSLYLATRLLDIAEAEGLARYATQRGIDLDQERQHLLVDARAHEAAIARREAEAARARAEAAQASTALERSRAEQAWRDAEAARQRAEAERLAAQQGLAAAEQARAEAERARAEAAAARESLQQMQDELADLKAKQTDRGLVVTIGDVLFATDRAELKPGAERELDKLVAALREHPEVTVQIEGHTDSTGNAGYNQELSERRAASVRRYLAANGIDPDRLRSVGLGEDYPVASNDTASGRQQNRRVEIVLQDDEARLSTRERD